MKYSQIDPDYAARRPPDSGSPRKPSSRPVEFVRSHVSTLKDLVYLTVGIVAVINWFQARASREEVDAAKKQCIESSTTEIRAALAPLAPMPQRLKAIEKKQARNDTRWDRLDAWHARAFRSPFKTPAPKFGPAAELRGEVRYEEGDEEE